MRLVILRKLMPSLFYTTQGDPVRCVECFSKDFVETVDALIDSYYGPVAEMHINCKHCKAFANEWAYGTYNPSTTIQPSWKFIITKLFGANQ